MKWQNYRQSTNVVEATPEDYQKTQDTLGMSPKLQGLKPISKYKIPSSQRTGQASMNPDGACCGGSDAQFFQHTTKDNIQNGQ